MLNLYHRAQFTILETLTISLVTNTTTAGTLLDLQFEKNNIIPSKHCSILYCRNAYIYM